MRNAIEWNHLKRHNLWFWDNIKKSRPRYLTDLAEIVHVALVWDPNHERDVFNFSKFLLWELWTWRVLKGSEGYERTSSQFTSVHTKNSYQK